MDFRYTPGPTKAVLGANSVAQLRDVAQDLGGQRLFLLCSAGMRARLTAVIADLGGACVGVFDGALPHCPEDTARAAYQAFEAAGADCIVPIGGGSTIGLGKYIKRHSGRPMIVVATTPCGSESTPIYGMLTGQRKETGRSDAVIADAAIYDPQLCTSLSASLTVTIGMNGLAHCVEALYAEQPSPMTTMFAEEGIRALTRGIRGSIAHPDDLDARSRLLYGGMLGGYCVNLAGIAIHHKICHVLGGRHGIAHGESNSVILPYAIAYNQDAAPDAMRRLERLMDSESAAEGVYDFARSIGVPASLREVGMHEADLDVAAWETVEDTRYNPRPVDFPSVRALLQQAFEGERPTAI